MATIMEMLSTSSPVSQRSTSSEPSDSMENTFIGGTINDDEENLVSHMESVSHTNTSKNEYLDDDLILFDDDGNFLNKEPNTNTHNNNNENDDNVQETIHHPSTPQVTTYTETTKTPKVKKVRMSNFTRNTLKPITTPRPESVGIDSTDDEDDNDSENENSDELAVPDEDDIAATDHYTLRQKEKWQETQKGASYHAYTTGIEEDEDKNDKPTPTPTPSKKKKRRSHVRGAVYFPSEELDGRYEFIRYLGHGSYGYVAEGVHIESGRKVALKKCSRIFHNRIDAKRLLRELKILRVLRGLDSIVQLIDILPPKDFDNFDQIILVFEQSDTDLSKLIQSDQYFTKLHVQYMLYQILLGLRCMHSLNIFHRDLKPQNILVNEDVSLKICDFGLARCIYNNQQFVNDYKQKRDSQNGLKKRIVVNPMLKNRMQKKYHGKRQLTQHVVTRWYRAPEVILLQQKREHLGAVDMWSVGCIFGELLQMLRENLRSYQHRKPIFPGQSSIPLSPPSDKTFPSMDQLTVIFGIIGTPTPEEVLNIDNERAARFLLQIPKCLPSPLKNMYPGADEQALSLLRGLLQFDVEKRITVEEALSHPFIQHVRDEHNEQKCQRIIQNIQAANMLNFEFEDIKMKMDTYRSLIIEEILRYNQHLLKHKTSAFSSFDFV